MINLSRSDQLGRKPNPAVYLQHQAPATPDQPLSSGRCFVRCPTSRHPTLNPKPVVTFPSQEASHICRGSDGSGAVMRMNGATQDELWSAVQRGDCSGFSSVWANSRVVPTEVRLAQGLLQESHMSPKLSLSPHYSLFMLAPSLAVPHKSALILGNLPGEFSCGF